MRPVGGRTDDGCANAARPPLCPDHLSELTGEVIPQRVRPSADPSLLQHIGGRTRAKFVHKSFLNPNRHIQQHLRKKPPGQEIGVHREFRKRGTKFPKEAGVGGLGPEMHPIRVAVGDFVGILARLLPVFLHHGFIVPEQAHTLVVD